MTSLGRALIGLAIAGLVLGLLVLTAIVTSDHSESPATDAAFTLLIGWSFIGTGLFAWYRRPANKIGALMAAVGFTWLLGGLIFANVPGLFVAGSIVGSLPITILVHMVLSFPSGRLEGRLAKWIVGVGYFITVVYLPIPHLFIDTTSLDACAADCPPNPILVEDNLALAERLFDIASVIGVVALTATLWLAVRRWRNADRETRRALGPDALGRARDPVRLRNAPRVRAHRHGPVRGHRLPRRPLPAGVGPLRVPRRAPALEALGGRGGGRGERPPRRRAPGPLRGAARVPGPDRRRRRRGPAQARARPARRRPAAPRRPRPVAATGSRPARERPGRGRGAARRGERRARPRHRRAARARARDPPRDPHRPRAGRGARHAGQARPH